MRPIRSQLKFSMMARNPRFSSPMRCDAGTRQSLKYRVAWSEAHHPILRSKGVRSKPGVPSSTKKSEMPPRPLSPVRAPTTKYDAFMPPVMNVFDPLST